MSAEKSNQFGEALLFILGEFAVAEDEHLEHGCMEVYGEDEQGREGSCEVTINDLAQAAIDEIKYLREQLAKANKHTHTCELEFERALDMAEECCNAKSKEDALKILEAFKSNTSFEKTTESFAELKRRAQELEQQLKERSPLEREQVPTLFVGLDMNVTTHRMDDSQIAVWCKGKDAYPLLKMIENAVDHNSFALLERQFNKEKKRAETAELQLNRLVEYGNEEALLYSVSFNGTRELVNDIKKDATDVGGCYEVSCGLLDSLFERFTDKGACELLNKFAIEKKVEALNLFVETIESTCDKHEVPIVGYAYNEAMKRTMLNIFRKGKDAMVEHLRKEQQTCSK